MRNLSPLLFLFPLLAGADALAQSVVVPNANANARGTGGLNTLTRDMGNPRTYMLGLPASELAGIPNGAVITGLSFRANISASNGAMWPATDATWSDYEISIGPAQPLASWTTTFASNFAGTPVMVHDGPLTIQANAFTNNTALPGTQPNEWGTFYFDFQQRFVYTGGDLAILFTHPGSNITGALFLDVIASAPATGVAYSGSAFQAATGAAATFSIPRVHYGYGTGCTGSNNLSPNLVLSGNVSGGNTVNFHLNNAPANAAAAFAFGLTRINGTLPNGCPLYTTPSIVLPVTLSQYGRHTITVRAPMGITGTIEIQGVAVDAGGPLGFTSTNGATLTVSP